MSQIPKLSDIILKNLSAEELYNTYSKSKLISTEQEILRRLKSGKNKDMINTLYNNRKSPIGSQLLKSIYVKNGLYEASKLVPWKIGVIYNYTDRSYRIKNIEIILGNTAYRVGKKIFKPNWSNSEKTKLTLREAISTNSRYINDSISTVIHDDDIISVLLNNNCVGVTLGTYVAPIGTGINSYPGSVSLSHGEQKEAYPYSLFLGDKNYKLINRPNNFTNYHVDIKKSADVMKLISLINLSNFK